MTTLGAAEPPRLVHVVRRGWPTLLAVAMTAFSWGIDAVTAGQLLTLLPLVYVTAVVLGRRSASWPLLGLGTACFLVLQAQSVVDPVVGFGVLSACAVACGVLTAGRRELALQAGALMLWLALVVLALSLSTATAHVLLAAGWAAHGAWDLWHLRRDAVVARSYAQWCGVFDVLMAVQLLAA